MTAREVAERLKPAVATIWFDLEVGGRDHHRVLAQFDEAASQGGPDVSRTDQSDLVGSLLAWLGIWPRC